MKTLKTLTRLTLSILLLSSSAVIAEDKMSYEDAMQSYKDAFGQYAEQSVTPEESQLSWDSHAQEPETNSSAQTILWQQSGGLNNGTIVLSQPYSNFDKLKFYGTSDSKNQGLVVTWDTADIDYFQQMTSAGDPMVIWYSDNERWNGRWKSDKRTFVQGQENARIHKVVGVTD